MISPKIGYLFIRGSHVFDAAHAVKHGARHIVNTRSAAPHLVIEVRRHAHDGTLEGVVERDRGGSPIVPRFSVIKIKLSASFLVSIGTT